MKVHLLDRRRMPARPARPSLGAAALWMALSLLRLMAPTYADSAAETPRPAPELRELWVPTQQLKEVLSRYPKAVLFTREQYEALIRDADVEHKNAPKAPRKAVLESAEYHGNLAGKVAQVTATFKINVLSDEWAHLALNFDGVSIGSVNVDGEAALAPMTPIAATANQDKNAPCGINGGGSLLLRGRGERIVTVAFTIPVSLEAGVSGFQIKLPPAAATIFSLDLPAGQSVESPQPVSIKNTPASTSVTAALAPAKPVLNLSWRTLKGGDQSLLPIVNAEGSYEIDSEKVRAEYDFDLKAALGSLPESATIDFPLNVKALQATGAEVAQWEMAGNNLLIHFQPGERNAAKLHVVVEAPALGAAPSAVLTLPIPRFENAARFSGTLSIRGDEGVTIKDVVTDTSLQVAPSEKPAPHFVGAYSFNTVPTPPRVTVEKLHARFSADLDSLVEFKQDAVFIERTITLHPEKGEVFDAAVNLPEGEEALTVRYPDGREPDWHIDGRRITIRWTRIPSTGLVFKLTTRTEPAKWSQIDADGINFTLNDAKVENAERVTGYIALKADDAFRLEAEPSDNLERRDGRTTPVKGDYAWFRGADFTLHVKIAKRPGELLASLTGYALPMEGILDLNAEINYDFLRSGAKLVRIRVPKDIAGNFYFDGPQIAERNLSGDVWTIVFQKALTGAYRMKVTGQVTVDRGAAHDAQGDASSQEDTGKESHFEIAVPQITPLDVARSSGVWAVEANTETEITFAAKGMNELDSLLAPKLAEYRPRHRVIGVFAWLGSDYSLTLSGVRHAPAKVLSSVVDRLNLDTVVSASGVERNQAVFKLRTAGAQYLDVELPEKSRLLSLSVDGDLVKPVGDRANRVRVQLPAKHDSEALAVSVLYETPKASWSGAGGYAVRAPRLDKSIPILHSQWRVFLPDGFEYTSVDSNLGLPPLPQEPPLLKQILHQLEAIRHHLPVPPFFVEETETVWESSEGWKKHTISKADDAKIKKLLFDAQRFFESGRFALADQRCNDVLAIDKGNVAARKLQEKIDKLSSDYGLEAHNETRADTLKELEMLRNGTVPRYERKPEPDQDVTGMNRTDAIQRKLDRIIIPKLDFHEVTIREAIDFLKKKSVELDTESPAGEKGVNIVLKMETPSASEAPAPAAAAVPGLDPIPRAAPAVPSSAPAPSLNPMDARITVSLTNIPLIEALRYVTNLAGLKFKVETYAVLIVPQSVNTDVLLTKEYIVKPKLIPRTGPNSEGLETTKGGESIAERETFKSYLISNGVTFTNPAASAIYLPGSSKLIVRNTQEQLDLIDQVVASNYRTEPTPDAARHRRSIQLQDSQIEAIQRKLDRIVIPKLDFREATIREAVDFLKKKSVELDIDSPIGSKGVNIVLKMESSVPPPEVAPPQAVPGLEPIPGAAAPVPAANPGESRITVTLTNIPLVEALRYVTNLAGLKFKVEPHAVLIVPQSVNTDVLLTKEFIVRPDLIPRTTAGSETSDAVDREAGKNWLISYGVLFSNPAASAVYLPGSSRLIVRNTEEQLDLIDTIISSNQQGYSPPGSSLESAVARPKKRKKPEVVRVERIQRKLDRIIIPKLEFKEATLSEALQFLVKKASDVDTDSPADERGVNIQTEGVEGMTQRLQEPNITVSLTNVPLVEALRYLTNLGGMKFKVTPEKVLIVPQSINTDVLLTKEWRVRSDLLPQTDGIGVVREAAKNWLISYGVIFSNPSSDAVFYAPVGRQKMTLGTTGATSMFLPSFGRLVVKNTQEQLDLIDTIIDGNNGEVSDEELQGGLRVSGLLPMKLELPKMGRTMVFDGFVAAERVQFRYEDWWSRARRLCAYFVLGGFGCLFLARHRPWRRTGWAILLLSFFPFVVTASAMSVCNALLAGWLVSVIIQRLAVRLVFAPNRKAVLA